MFKDSKAIQEKGVVVSFLPTGEYYFNKGINAYHRHDLKKAKKYLQRAAQLEPFEPMIACQLALVYMHLEEYQKSNDLLHSILKDLDPRMTECHYFMANNYAELGLFGDAHKHARIYLDQDPLGEFTEEAEDLIYIINTEEAGDYPIDDQDELIVQQEKARELLESGNFGKAVEILEEMIKNYPDYWSAYNNLALGYFYLGDMDKAAGVLEDLLKKNPGNLHALCNIAVFLYHQRRDEELDELLEGLTKVQPILIEHQYKLGATFALLGQYEQSYMWLNKLKKCGFDGDAGYYYWYSLAAYHTGHRKAADNAWKSLLELSPEKEGHEPWNEERPRDAGFEGHITSILKKLRSEYMEERLFGIFLLSVSKKKQDVIAYPDFKQLEEFTLTEKIYLANVLDANIKDHFDPDGAIAKGHQIALCLYEQHQPVSAFSSGLFLMWFSIFLQGLKEGRVFSNEKACAAAVEYEWYKVRGEKKTQQELAEIYHISTSTLQKYVKLIKELYQ
jgi:tetratricopeptide (TPR) repeat protein